MPTVPRVGGDIDAVCSKCKMVLGHTVLAMVGAKAARVRCNTCQGEHKFKAPPSPGSEEKAKVAKAARTVKSNVTSWEALLQGKDLSRARRYNMKERFEEGEVLQHPTFGMGLVQTARSDKLEVVFNTGAKTLIHAKP
jgi:hypothetical protein